MVRHAALITVLALVALSTPARAECLTKEEARSRWPTTHLYWHTEHRCWDNSRTWSSSQRALALTTRKIPPPRAEEPAPPLPRPSRFKHYRFLVEDYCCWPPLDTLIPPGLIGHTRGEPK